MSLSSKTVARKILIMTFCFAKKTSLRFSFAHICAFIQNVVMLLIKNKIERKRVLKNHVANYKAIFKVILVSK